MLFRNCSLMLIFLMDADRQDNVEDVFQRIYIHLGADLYRKLFPVILTDNGASFKNQTFLNGLKVNFCPMSFTATQWLPGRRDAWKRITNSSVISSQKV